MLNFYKMISATSFSQSILWIEPTLQALPRNSSSSSVNFRFPISLLLVQKIILTIPTNTPFIYITQQFFTSLFLHTTIATIYTKNISPTLNIPYQLRLRQGSRGVMEYCENWHCFNLSLLPQSMIVIAGLTHNHWFFIAQTQKIDILQVWHTIKSTFSNTINLFSLLLCLTNITARTNIPLEISCLIWI